MYIQYGYLDILTFLTVQCKHNFASFTLNPVGIYTYKYPSLRLLMIFDCIFIVLFQNTYSYYLSINAVMFMKLAVDNAI